MLHHDIEKKLYIVIKCLLKSSVDKTLYFGYSCSSPSIKHSDSSSASAEIRHNNICTYDLMFTFSLSFYKRLKTVQNGKAFVKLTYIYNNHVPTLSKAYILQAVKCLSDDNL